MARLPRLSVADQTHYVVMHGTKDVSLIPMEEDVNFMFGVFSKVCRAESVAICAYAILPEEIHMLMVPHGKAENLSKAVQQINRLYSRYFNEAYSRTGTIWQGRFESSLLQGKGKILQATVFMEWLPYLRKALDPQYYPWTSFPHHAGLRSDFFVSPSKEYWELGNTPFERQKKYKEIFANSVSKSFGESLLKSVKRGWPIADEEFLAELNIAEQRIRPQRKRGRPQKSKENSD